MKLVQPSRFQLQPSDEPIDEIWVSCGKAPAWYT
jgi:hypothetical protein